MTGRCKGFVLAGTFAAMLLSGGTAAPQAPPLADAFAAEEEAEAERYFRKGDEHFDKGEYREAYELYRKSLAIKKKRAAMAQAASTLKLLGRPDEALDLLDELRRDFPDLPPGLAAKVASLVADVRALVGTLTFTGDLPDGGSLFVDDRLRGKLPLAAPLRVSKGGHAIRVEKDGFLPITASAEVAAGQAAVVRLVAPSKKGRLEVREKHNWPLTVEVDGNDVGVTPWDGLLEIGAHRVRLHGFVKTEVVLACEVPDGKPGEKPKAAESGVKMESAQETASVRLYEVTQVVLGVQDQDASLKVESTPRRARVWIDAKEVGRTPWEGRVALGQHTIEVEAKGYLPSSQRVTLERRRQREVSVRLVPEATSAVRDVGSGVAFGVGGLGFLTFAVAGGLALDGSNRIKADCPDNTCPGSKGPLLEDTKRLAALSTASLGIGAVGVAVGTLILVTAPSSGRAGTAGVSGWKVGAGPGWLELGGRF
jgi:hypothetical protein